MSIIQGTSKSSGGGYEIDQSIRFDGSTSYMYRTPASTTNQKTWTWSGWVKGYFDRSSGDIVVFGAGNGSGTYTTELRFQVSTESLYFFTSGTGGTTSLISSSKYRDPSAWYHIVVAVDTTQATASDRIKIYVNGDRLTAFSTETYQAQNTNTAVNYTNQHNIGKMTYAGYYYPGYQAEINLIDGQQLAPTDFGEYNDDGVWIPKAYEGTYGTNGFYITGEDSADLGADYSGNSNDFTSTGLTSDDQMLDTPTDNFCVLNPLDGLGASPGTSTFSNGNLSVALNTSSNYAGVRGSMSFDAANDYYFEVEVTGNTGAGIEMGIVKPNVWASSGYPSSLASGNAVTYWTNGNKWVAGASSAYGSTYTTGDFIGVHVQAGSIFFYKNGTIQNSGTAAATGLTGLWTFGASHLNNTGGTESFTINFGATAFTHAGPSGSSDVSTSNLPTPAIANGSNNFNTYTWTGNGGGQRIASFQPITETYTIDNSVRFNDDDSAYLTDTLGTATDANRWTYSAWVKRGALPGTQMGLINSNFAANDTGFLSIQFDSDNTFFMTGQSTRWRQTSQVFRDASAWYHIVVAVDTDQGTADNRIKIYVNGGQVTSFSTTNNPSSGANLGLNQAAAHELGRDNGGIRYFDGYMADINFIDGQALAASDFGQYDASTNRWVPKAYSGSYGTNGFLLEFGDSAALGDDTSGNANDFTSSGLTADDQVTDTPTENFATYTPLYGSVSYPATFSDGNLTAAGASSTGKAALASIGTSTGKWYGEFTVDAVGTSSLCRVGVVAVDNLYDPLMFSASEYAPQLNNVLYFANGTLRTYVPSYSDTASWGSTFTTNDIIGVAYDADTGKVWFAKNNTWQSSGDPAAGTDPAVTLATGTPFYFQNQIFDNTWTANFGQLGFTYTPPDGFVALNADNLPLTGGNISAFSWIKSRSSASYNHQLYDRVRDVTKVLASNSTAAETTDANGLQTFLLDGFQLGNSTSVNAAGTTYVGWNWMTSTSGSGSSNIDGSITSTVLADTTAGFSAVTWTGDGTSTVVNSIGHGLGKAPSFIIMRRLSPADDWFVYAEPITESYYLRLNNPAAKAIDAYDNIWGGTAPTSSVFSVESVGSAAYDYVAYCFAEVEGFSKFGSYTGNGSADGSVVNLGFTPAFILFKNASAYQSWCIFDVARGTYNVLGPLLLAEQSDAETSVTYVDALSNGFKLRTTNARVNGSSATHIYAAFAEHPFGGDGVAPATAR